MRTDEEIIKRIEAIKDEDLFGFETTDLITFLSYEAAKPYMKTMLTAEEFAQVHESDARSAIVDYLPFAWDKANNCRGLSAMRSLDHMRAWLWIMGEDELVQEIKHYTHYGKPQLVKISDLMNFPWRDHDNNRWVNSESEPGQTSEEVLNDTV